MKYSSWILLGHTVVKCGKDHPHPFSRSLPLERVELSHLVGAIVSGKDILGGEVVELMPRECRSGQE